MMTEQAAPVVRIADAGTRAPVEVHGVLIGRGTSRRDDSLAWAEIEVYRLNDGGYLAHRAGYSLVYHTKGTRCVTRNQEQRGELVPARQLPPDAEPCVRCRPEPPDYLPDGAEVRWETPRHTFDNCNDPQQVEERLTVIRHPDRSRSVRYSKPVRDALREASRNDPEFRRAGIDGSERAVRID